MEEAEEDPEDQEENRQEGFGLERSFQVSVQLEPVLVEVHRRPCCPQTAEDAGP